MFPYLLREIDITGPNQVWAADLTYIRMKGRCEIFNTDQGAQFTSKDWINTLKDHGISIKYGWSRPLFR